MMRFATMMPDMDPEVAEKIVGQFPEFKLFAIDALNVMEKRHESTLSHNQQSQDSVHRAFQEIREILKGQLEHEDCAQLQGGRSEQDAPEASRRLPR